MNLKEKLNNDFKEAFKAKEEVRLSVLKMVKAAISNAEIEKRAKMSSGAPCAGCTDCELGDEDVLTVISREVKKRKDAIEAYVSGGRPELAEGEKKEIEFLSVYLPAQMSEDEIRELAKKAIADSGASGTQDFGKAMKAVSALTKGRADGGLVSKIVKELLG